MPLFYIFYQLNVENNSTLELSFTLIQIYKTFEAETMQILIVGWKTKLMIIDHTFMTHIRDEISTNIFKNAYLKLEKEVINKKKNWQR